MTKILPILLLAALVVACQERQPTAVLDGAPVLFAISDGASGGNPDFFFYPPLADNPTANDNYDQGEFNEFLAPFVRICHFGTTQPPAPTGQNPPACSEPADPVPMTLDVDNELYRFQWKTTGLQHGHYYRLQVFVGTPETGHLGFRDVLALDGPATASCPTSEPFCQVNINSNVAIKVRIENGAFCPVVDGVRKPCQTRSFDLANNGVSFNLQDKFLLNVPTQPASQQGTVTFQACKIDNTANLIDLPLFGPCMETVLLSGQPIELDPAYTATISFCDVDITGFGLSLAQTENLRVHHFRGPNGDQGVEALRVANDCPETTGSLPSSPIERFASQLLSWIAPRPLHAAAFAGKGGFGGNSMETIGSKFRIALPAKIDFVDVADATRVALAGSPLRTRAFVTDLNGAPVKGATVRWNVADVGGVEGAQVAGSVAPLAVPVGCAPGGTDDVVCTTPASGIVEVDWTLAIDPGINKLTAGGRGIADSREAFNGPRGKELDDAGNVIAYPTGSFDPFQPIAWSESSEDRFESPGDEISTDIVANTRLLFTAIGCEEGFGTPSVNGVIGSGEWDCATERKFPVNLSGGSTVEATLYYMNDTERFYLAVVVPGTGRVNGLRVDWDSDGDGNAFGREVGDDVWEFDPDLGFTDKFIDEKCSTSSQSGCGNRDADFGGSNQTFAGFRNDMGGVTVYEMSHPLSTADKCTKDGSKGCGAALNKAIDLNVAAGYKAGLFLTLRLGSGAQGNTQWPDFLSYHEVTFK